MSPGTFLDVCSISGIPNVLSGVYDDGYRSSSKKEKKSVKVTVTIDDHQYSGLLEET